MTDFIKSGSVVSRGLLPPLWSAGPDGRRGLTLAFGLVRAAQHFSMSGWFRGLLSPLVGRAGRAARLDPSPGLDRTAQHFSQSGAAGAAFPLVGCAGRGRAGGPGLWPWARGPTPHERGTAALDEARVVGSRTATARADSIMRSHHHEP